MGIKTRYSASRFNRLIICLVLTGALFAQEGEDKGTKSGIEGIDTTVITTGESVSRNLIFSAGFQGGTYFKVATALSEIPEARITVQTANGSIENVKKVKEGKADLALTQLDILVKFALKKEEYRKKVKILLPLFGEELHLVAVKSIKTVDQLEERTVSIGPNASGSAGTARILLNELGNIDDSVKKLRLQTPDALNKLLKGDSNLSAFFLVAGAPVEIFSSLPADAGKKIHLVPIDEGVHEELLKKGMPYTMSTIYKKNYKWLDKDVPTLAVGSAIVVSSSVSEDDVKNLLKIIFSRQSDLKKKHEKWREFDIGLAKFYLNAYSKYFHPAAAAFIKGN